MRLCYRARIQTRFRCQPRTTKFRKVLLLGPQQTQPTFLRIKAPIAWLGSQYPVACLIYYTFSWSLPRRWNIIWISMTICRSAHLTSAKVHCSLSSVAAQAEPACTWIASESGSTSRSRKPAPRNRRHGCELAVKGLTERSRDAAYAQAQVPLAISTHCNWNMFIQIGVTDRFLCTRTSVLT